MGDGKRPRVVQVGERFADRDVRDARQRDDLAGASLLRVHALERLGHVELPDLGLLDRTVGPAPGHRLAAADGPVSHPAERQASQVRRGVQVGHQRLQRMIVVVLGRGDVLAQRLEQRLQVLGQGVGVRAAAPGPRVAVKDRELDVMVLGVQVHEQLVDLVDHLGDARIGPVDLVHHQDHGQVRLERLPKHEPRLRQRTLARVHQQQHAVHHGQPAFDLAAEVGVAGRVHDVDLQIAVANGRVLRQDRDALLALQVHGVHDPLAHVLVRAERAGLPEHGVDQRGLAVVDVRHDRHVADVVAEGHGQTASSRRIEGARRRTATHSKCTDCHGFDSTSPRSVGSAEGSRSRSRGKVTHMRQGISAKRTGIAGVLCSLMVAAGLIAWTAGPAAATVFSNTAAMTIPGVGPARGGLPVSVADHGLRLERNRRGRQRHPDRSSVTRSRTTSMSCSSDPGPERGLDGRCRRDPRSWPRSASPSTTPPPHPCRTARRSSRVPSSRRSSAGTRSTEDAPAPAGPYGTTLVGVQRNGSERGVEPVRVRRHRR